MGVLCPGCGYVAALPRPRCPACGGRPEEARFGPSGRVWSSTVVRVEVADRSPPWSLAYVDVDAGPRILAHVRGGSDAPLEIGRRAHLTGVNEHGDIEVEVAP